jgi:DNA replication and repair protein RecF
MASMEETCLAWEPHDLREPMTLRRIALTGFRNLRDAVLELPVEGVALIGRNAQGKSNFLEAIYYLEILRSFRRADDAELVRSGESHFRVAAELDDGRAGLRAIAAAFDRRARKKKVTLEGQEMPRLGDAIGHLGAVLFTPDDVRLLSDGPAERRRFLDVVLSVNRPGYLAALQRFRHVLTQRNAALRDASEPASARAWDPALIEAAARVAEDRASWIGGSVPRFGELYSEVAGRGASATMRYDPGIPDSESADSAAFAHAYARALEASWAQDVRRGSTRVGPQRDEVTFSISSAGERAFRSFGSAGEKRTAAFVLRLLEAETVRARRGAGPLFLLDDVFAELDEARSARVTELLARSAHGQIVLAAPRESDIRFGSDRVARWRIEAGSIAQ